MKRSNIKLLSTQNSSRDNYHIYSERDLLKGTSIKYKGTWTKNNWYYNDDYIIDLVASNGALYICKESNYNISVDNKEYWDIASPSLYILLVESGYTGSYEDFIELMNVLATIDELLYNSITNVTFTDNKFIFYRVNGNIEIDLSFLLPTKAIEEHNNSKLSHDDIRKNIITLTSDKVVKESGKGLSSNDYTTLEKNKLQSLSNYDDTSVHTELEKKQNIVDNSLLTIEKKIPTAINELVNKVALCATQTVLNNTMTTHNTSDSAHNILIQTTLNSAKDYTNSEITKLIGAAPEVLDTLEELAKAILDNKDVIELLTESISTKLSKTEAATLYISKLESLNFTQTDKNKLDNIASGADVNVQANWASTDIEDDSFIKNKPDLNNYSLKTETALKVDKTNESLQTVSKDVVGAINEVNSKAAVLNPANETELGGIKAATKTDLETSPVKIDANGFLYVLPGTKGDTGKSGVEISITQPIDPDVNVWIKPDGIQSFPQLIVTITGEESTGYQYTFEISNYNKVLSTIKNGMYTSVYIQYSMAIGPFIKGIYPLIYNAVENRIEARDLGKAFYVDQGNVQILDCIKYAVIP